MPTSILNMRFQNDEGDRRTISVRNSVENPDSAAVEALMDNVINNEVFKPNNLPLTTKIDASVRTTMVEEVADFTGE